MSSVQEIESAISKLSRHDLTELESWFAEFTTDAWDRQIADDARSGKLNALYQRLEQENKGEADAPLDEVLTKKSFRTRYATLSPEIRNLARKNFQSS